MENIESLINRFYGSEFENFKNDHHDNKPTVIWFTGLSGAGKTTISLDLMRRFNSDLIHPILLDGDNIRSIIPNIGFDEDSRKKHNLTVGKMASMLEKQGNIVIVSLISPYIDVREEIRNQCENYIEVYVSTDFETCKNRDTKGLYQKAISGEISNFTGLTAAYDIPLLPELTLDTTELDLESCSKLIYEFYQKSS